jgi:hypothetical protein
MRTRSRWMFGQSKGRVLTTCVAPQQRTESGHPLSDEDVPGLPLELGRARSSPIVLLTDEEFYVTNRVSNGWRP